MFMFSSDGQITRKFYLNQNKILSLKLIVGEKKLHTIQHATSF